MSLRAFDIDDVTNGKRVDTVKSVPDLRRSACSCLACSCLACYYCKGDFDGLWLASPPCIAVECKLLGTVEVHGRHDVLLPAGDLVAVESISCAGLRCNGSRPSVAFLIELFTHTDREGGVGLH